MSAATVFWAVELPEGSAHVDLDDGSASLHVENLRVYDAFTVGNSIAGVNRPVNLVKGVVDSLEIKWSGILASDSANQPVNKMRGNFVVNTARIAVTATTPRTAVTALSNGHGFRFVSDKASTSISHFAEIGQERNGVFY